MKKVEKSFHIHVGEDSTGEELVEALRAVRGILDEVGYMIECVAHYVADDGESRETLTDAAGLVGIVSLNVAHVATDLELCEYGCD